MRKIGQMKWVGAIGATLARGEKPLRVRCSERPIWLLVISVLLLFSACDRAKFDLSALSGTLSYEYLSAEALESEFSIKMKLIGADRSEEWATAAYAGFSEDGNRNNSIQFMLVDEDHKDNVSAGYRIMKNGERIKSVKIAELPRNEWVKVSMTFKKSKVAIALNGIETIREETELGTVAQYVAVSSGKARFEVLESQAD